MADIFDFPRDARNVARADGKGADMGGEAPQTMLMRPQGVPDQVWNAVLSVDRMRRLKGMTYREIPVPNSMANFGIGVALECDETYASGSERTGTPTGVAWLSHPCHCPTRRTTA